MEHHNFEYPALGVPNDEFDPKYAGFYGPPIHGTDMNAGDASEAFQLDWLARVQEVIDKYHPELTRVAQRSRSRERRTNRLRWIERLADGKARPLLHLRIDRIAQTLRQHCVLVDQAEHGPSFRFKRRRIEHDDDELTVIAVFLVREDLEL